MKMNNISPPFNLNELRKPVADFVTAMSFANNSLFTSQIDQESCQAFFRANFAESQFPQIQQSEQLFLAHGFYKIHIKPTILRYFLSHNLDDFFYYYIKLRFGSFKPPPNELLYQRNDLTFFGYGWNEKEKHYIQKALSSKWLFLRNLYQHRHQILFENQFLSHNPFYQLKENSLLDIELLIYFENFVVHKHAIKHHATYTFGKAKSINQLESYYYIERNILVHYKSFLFLLEAQYPINTKNRNALISNVQMVLTVCPEKHYPLCHKLLNLLEKDALEKSINNPNVTKVKTL